MLVMFESRTGNVQRFIRKLQLPSRKIQDEMTVDEPFVLVTYTTGFGQPPENVMAFLKNNAPFLRGVAASGNRNWGESFAKSADYISRTFGVPIVSKFELSGTSRDVQTFLTGVQRLATY
ncbi:class Ib ribonucleoside-diphosphate reductase assembly flavoprotein NrdI [Paenibacillus sp.]|uniref:class Ib ribonucleoside-diphosphate reductase assembly flavoprotein NrdI n=1 Tax=Paenibacillus sp. TaxID=58172 RepID=UPI0028125DB6|nr:class Ib ribonucleoside-diphosphate reductase assembly flavoprotein NrdI [Paenibacillus sp.]